LCKTKLLDVNFELKSLTSDFPDLADDAREKNVHCLGRNHNNMTSQFCKKISPTEKIRRVGLANTIHADDQEL
jgi:hypothetical protein